VRIASEIRITAWEVKFYPGLMRDHHTPLADRTKEVILLRRAVSDESDGSDGFEKVAGSM
jgi:hypothetical protein